MAGYTPEPWVGGNSTNTGAHELIGDGQQLVALVYGRTKEEQDANLALLAAAPGLLAAAEELLGYVGAGDPKDNVEISRVAALRAAVAKATGAA